MSPSPFEFGGIAEPSDKQEVVQSLSICLNPPKPNGVTGGAIVAATLSATEVKSGGDTIDWYLSADGGSNFESVTNDSRHEFTNTGSDLRWKAILTGSGGVSTYAELIKVKYEVI